jgi:hypothetical protein
MQNLNQICQELGIERGESTPSDVTVDDFRQTGELPEGVKNHASLFVRDNGLNFKCAVRVDDLLEAYCDEDGIIICTDGRGVQHEINVDTFIIGANR